MPAMPEISLRTSLERMRQIGFAPATVFDIGVATGTSGLYKVFGDVAYVLVDPLAESEPFMKEICGRVRRGVYKVAAAAARPGEASIAVHPGLSGSGALLKGDYPRRKVPAVTLDQLVDEFALDGPFLVKIDVQGSELEVLKGLERHADKAEVVVCEASLWADRKKWGAPSFADMVAYMAARGFVLYDLANIAYRPRDGAIAEMDLVFCRQGSELRRFKSYRSSEQQGELVEHKLEKFAEASKPQL
jgi:FkbM family methyltransferase